MTQLACAEPLSGGGPCRAIPGMVVLEGDGVARCLTHTRDTTRARRRDERNSAGGHGKLRVPDSPPTPTFDTRRRVVAFLEKLATLVMAGEIDPRLSAEARQCAATAMEAHTLDSLERLDKLEQRILGRRSA